MTPQELERIGKALYGQRWKPQMAAALDVDATTIWRYVTGQVPIPGPVAAALKCFLREKRRG